MTKPILKLFQASGSPIVGAFLTPCTNTQFQGTPSAESLNTRGGPWWKLVIFDGNRRLSWKRYEIG